MDPIKKTVELTFFHKSILPKKKELFVIIDEFGDPEIVEYNFTMQEWHNLSGYKVDEDFFYCKIPESLRELKEKL